MSLLDVILVIEDDALIRQAVHDALAGAGYSVLACGCGEEGLQELERAEVALVLLDLVLPGRGGFDVLAEIQRHHAGLPVIILTARGDEGARVRGLRGGADDFVVKPFSVRELLARVDAVLRRCQTRPERSESQQLATGLRFDYDRRLLVQADGSRTELSAREAELLRYFSRHTNRTIPRDELIRYVWQLDPRGVKTRTIDVHVARLREKLLDTKGQLIVTVRGRGYRFSPDPEE